MSKSNSLGMPWWVFLGGGALVIFLMMRGKGSSKTAPSTQPGTNLVIMPTGGWSYPKMTPATFKAWCKANSGLMTGGTCLISNKGAYTLDSGRLKTGGQWVVSDNDLF
jgi:hypothetical protein